MKGKTIHLLYISNDLLTAIFAAVRKKAVALDCDDHRTICLMSHTTKVLFKIIMRRVRNKIDVDIRNEQCGLL